ncbi:MAG: caspase family protein [Nitrospirae bacterium]|nr:caspase family protein [Nitrospirota bacterium]
MEEANYTVIREPHAVLARYQGGTDISYAFYFYPSQTDGQTEVEVLIASPWLTTEQMRKFQEQVFTASLVDINRKLLEKGYDPNVKVEGMWLPLSTAAFDGEIETAKKLISKGADVDLAIYELKEAASKQSPYLNYPDNRKIYDKANLGVEMLSRLTPRQAEPKTVIATGTVAAFVQEKPLIKSDVDELPAIKAKPNKNSYAIVIGIENYRQKLPKADYAVADAKTMTEYLTKVMGYPEENVVTLTNDHAAKSDFEKYFEKWLWNNVEKDSTVFIYYSGHGAPNPKTGDAYLVPYDGDPTFIAETGYSLKRLYESLGKLQAKEIIVALDSCFSGAGGRSVIAKGSRPLVMTMESSAIPSKVAVLSSSSGDQISSTYEEKGHGLFTYFMLKGIKDGITEIGELFDYLKPHVGRTARKVYNNEQTPQLIAPEKKKVFLRN